MQMENGVGKTEARRVRRLDWTQVAIGTKSFVRLMLFSFTSWRGKLALFAKTMHIDFNLSGDSLELLCVHSVPYLDRRCGAGPTILLIR